MKILAVDTSSRMLCVAIADGDRIISSHNRLIGFEHSKMLVPAIEGLLKKSSLKIGGIDAFAVGLGPGSFTGLRIGVSAMKGYAFALERPITGVSTLDALALRLESSADGKDIYTVIDAKRQNIYWCRYRFENGKMKRVTSYLLTPPEKMIKSVKSKSVFLGDAIDVYGRDIKKALKAKAAFLDKGYWYPKAEYIARLGYEKLRRGQSYDVDTIAPMYMHSKYCQVKK
ncbi:MAG: tRNA (adenosine(37)-N6)-threonylcarbamoyltransferase complex dimerization subunit type 1 TsaB [Candidatus Omnitrophica bacterium CG1_02_49_10]|nr:MAG: tRNA (adenosine(37)-N6)-threonylcarbamoyltransferase complex dimerization subunit type 1 TsaB [Candidatus Omnitrophica bacterium CG1_02_49_10]